MVDYDDYAHTDEQINEVLEYLLEKVLNPSNLLIEIESLNKRYSLNDLLVKIESDPLHKYDYVKALINFNKNINQRFDRIKQEIQSLLRQKIIPIEVLINELESMETRNDELTNQLERLSKVMDKFIGNTPAVVEEEPKKKKKSSVGYED